MLRASSVLVIAKESKIQESKSSEKCSQNHTQSYISIFINYHRLLLVVIPSKNWQNAAQNSEYIVFCTRSKTGLMFKTMQRLVKEADPTDRLTTLTPLYDVSVFSLCKKDSNKTGSLLTALIKHCNCQIWPLVKRTFDVCR